MPAERERTIAIKFSQKNLDPLERAGKSGSVGRRAAPVPLWSHRWAFSRASKIPSHSFDRWLVCLFVCSLAFRPQTSLACSRIYLTGGAYLWPLVCEPQRLHTFAIHHAQAGEAPASRSTTIHCGLRLPPNANSWAHKWLKSNGTWLCAYLICGFMSHVAAPSEAKSRLGGLATRATTMARAGLLKVGPLFAISGAGCQPTNWRLSKAGRVDAHELAAPIRAWRGSRAN